MLQRKEREGQLKDSFATTSVGSMCISWPHCSCTQSRLGISKGFMLCMGCTRGTHAVLRLTSAQMQPKSSLFKEEIPENTRESLEWPGWGVSVTCEIWDLESPVLQLKTQRRLNGEATLFNSMFNFSWVLASFLTNLPEKLQGNFLFISKAPAKPRLNFSRAEKKHCWSKAKFEYDYFPLMVEWY